MLIRLLPSSADSCSPLVSAATSAFCWSTYGVESLTQKCYARHNHMEFFSASDVSAFVSPRRLVTQLSFGTPQNKGNSTGMFQSLGRNSNLNPQNPSSSIECCCPRMLQGHAPVYCRNPLCPLMTLPTPCAMLFPYCHCSCPLPKGGPCRIFFSSLSPS